MNQPTQATPTVPSSLPTKRANKGFTLLQTMFLLIVLGLLGAWAFGAILSWLQR